MKTSNIIIHNLQDGVLNNDLSLGQTVKIFFSWETEYGDTEVKLKNIRGEIVQPSGQVVRSLEENELNKLTSDEHIEMCMFEVIDSYDDKGP